MSVSTLIRQYFSLEQATRSMVLVEPITREIVDAYAALMNLQQEVEVLEQAMESDPDQAPAIESAIEELSSRLRLLTDRCAYLLHELQSIGCVLKDMKIGIVDFPAMREGRIICFCWQLGETSLSHWHEANEDFEGRHKISSSFLEDSRIMSGNG